MKQADLGLNLSAKRTRKREFLEQMDRVVASIAADLTGRHYLNFTEGDSRRYGAQVDWLPFFLHPEYPEEGVPRSDLERRYGPVDSGAGTIWWWSGTASGLACGSPVCFRDDPSDRTRRLPWP